MQKMESTLAVLKKASMPKYINIFMNGAIDWGNSTVSKLCQN